MSEEISQVLSSSSALADLPSEAVTALAEAARERTLHAGDVLFEAGSPADGMVVIARGRLGVLDPDGQVIATMGRGDVVGEMGALTGEQRSNKVIALRDTALLELDQAGFDRVFESSHVVGRALSRLVIDRLVGSDDERGGKTVPAMVAVVTVGAGPGVDQVVDALEHSVTAAAVVGPDLARGRSDGEILTALETVENDHDLVVLLAGDVEGGDAWLDRCLRQADSTLVVVNEPRARPPEGMAALADRLRRLRSVVELVIVNPPSAEHGIDAHDWIRALDPDRWHHVREGDRSSVERAARLVVGQGLGLVFSGGAAKGLAHLGAWRAIQELGIQIDAVAGVSFGALMGAGVALDYPAKEMYQQVEERLVTGSRGLADLTFPWMALLRGQEISKRLEDVAGGRCFEQTWRDFVCTSCDLTTGRIVEHRSGPIWQAIRASVSIPGLLPPVGDGGRLLVDGAIRNNLPVANLRAGHPTPMRVIAVDVGKDGYLDAGKTTDTGHMSGWRLMYHRLNPRRPDPGVPSMAQVLMRVMELAGDETEGVPDEIVRPDLTGLGLAAFDRVDDFEIAGYEATIEALG